MIVCAKTSVVTGRRLKEALGVPLLKADGARAASADRLILYGVRRNYAASKQLNRNLNNFNDKVEALRLLGDTAVPNSTQPNPDWPVTYCRTLTRSRSGRGIVIARSPEEIVAAPLYTKGLEGTEYRVHVFGNDTFVTQKRRRNGAEANPNIRTHENGWVFCRNDVEIRPGLRETAIEGISRLGLDFGAADIIYNERAYILEVNSAPGLEGSVLDWYVGKFQDWINND